MQSKLLNGLNKNQLQAVASVSPTILCLAGAGSGKTTVLTRRIAHLFDNRVGTSNMLALTFTRLAGKEMKERVISLIGQEEGQKLFCNTFHAFAVQVIKEWGHVLGIEKNFTIYDQEDRESILTVIQKELGSKTTLKKLFDAFESGPEKRSEEYRVLTEYDWRLRQNNAIDLDRLIKKAVQLLRQSQEALDYYQRTYTHIFVDEFQDSNDEQMELIQLLNPPNLFVVGDDFQAIYGWRGARVDFILDFPNLYDCEVVKLEDNYRSTREIVAAANNLIAYNENQSEKTLIAHKYGEQITVSTSGDERMEYEEIASKIGVLLKQGTAYKDIAILSRTNMQLSRMQSQLDRSGVPNVALGRNDIMKNRDIRSIVAWLQVIINQKDGMALKRALDYPEPLLSENEKNILKLEAIKQEKSELAMLKELDFRGSKKFFGIGSMIFDFYAKDSTVSELIMYTADVLGILKEYESQGLQNRLHALQGGLEYIKSWEDSKRNLGEDNRLSAFLNWLKYRDIQEKLVDEKDAVKLMTMHGAKGLEFPTVFLIGLVEDTFPSRRGDIEEERRLAYVGITRAKEKLFLSHSKTKQDWNGSVIFAEKSRFLDEIM